MKVKTIPSTWITAEGRRLDCGPFMSGVFEARMMLARLSCRKDRLVDVCAPGGVFIPGRFRRVYVEDPEYGVPWLSPSDIQRADLSSLSYVSKVHTPSLDVSRIRPGYILLTRSGTIGNMVYTRPDMDGLIGSDDIIRIVADPDRILPGYLYAFMSSRLGRSLIEQNTYGTIIPHLEPHHIAEMPVPRLETDTEITVHRLVEKAAHLLSVYQGFINDASNRLFSAVGLSDISPLEWHKIGPDLSFDCMFPNQDSFRAMNFNPRFRLLCDRIRSGSWKPLGEICVSGTLQRGGRYKRIDAEPEFSYQLIGQKQLFWLRPEGRWVAKSALGPDVLVEPGVILVAAQGTLGERELFSRAEFAWGPGANLAYSEHILRVISDEAMMPSGCLFAFMRSETAFRMLRSISVGSKLQDHHHVFRSQIPVPYPVGSTQEEIHALVTRAYDARYEAIALEDEARSLVEQAIEGAA